MKYCLPSQLSGEFLKRLKSGEINPENMSKLGSEGRRKYFASFLGDMHAKEVNALFESKLLLKNQQQGMINWAKKVSGIKPDVRRDILSKVESLGKVLEPSEKQAFLEDLASTRLGFGVSMTEAGKIAELSKIISEKDASRAKGGDRMEYGRALVAFHNYVNDLKLRSAEKTVFEEIKDPLGLLVKSAGYAKAMKSTLDNSALLRQGWKVLLTHPNIWQKNARQSFENIVKTFGGKEVMNEVLADIVSRDTFLSMKKAKLDVGKLEEAFPVHLPQRIPVIGKAFKASEVAYTAFLQKTRADLFDAYLDIAKKSGVDITDQFQLESIGKLVNSMTGRGSLGKFETVSGPINNVFFSPKNLKSNIDTLLLHPTDKMSGFARKQAAINLVKIISGTSAILALANAVKQKDTHVESDPRSADFGKIRYKDSTFDVSGGMASLVTLASRLSKSSYKSTISGKVVPLNTGKYGAPTSIGMIYNFFENKLSPAMSVVKDLLKQKTFEGDKPTFLSELKNLSVPMPINTFLELKNNPNSANILLAMIADGLGVGVNTYDRKRK